MGCPGETLILSLQLLSGLAGVSLLALGVPACLLLHLNLIARTLTKSMFLLFGVTLDFRMVFLSLLERLSHYFSLNKMVLVSFMRFIFR